MRKSLIESAEPLPLEIAEWMGLANSHRRTLVEEDLKDASERHGRRDLLRALLTRRLAS